MAKFAELPIPDDGSIVANITHFARALRKAGLPVGTGRLVDAIRAVDAVGFTEKRDFYWTLHACFVSRPEHRDIFAQVFRLYWRDPQYLENIMAMLAPTARRVPKEHTKQAAERRAAEALLDGAKIQAHEQPEEEGSEIELDASLTFSSREYMRTLDFEQMTVAEMTEAKRMIANIRLPVQPLVSRRTRATSHGHIPDWQGTIRRAMRTGGDIQRLAMRKKTIRWPNLVAICDISGSMSSYSRAVLHFLHAASNAKGAGWSQVHSFTFGTRLTNITRHMRHRDVDAALSLVGYEARDWDGGTRIGECLRTFNRDWSRRVLGQGAVVLLITDGLERDEPGKLAAEIERLHLSAQKIIWLNPLLRWDGFAPKARGIREILPHVDSFRAGHNIASLQGLAFALSQPEDIGEKARFVKAMRET
ncbi:MAG: VWA domain-containing protein [Paracoccaceae bacterium]|jgi:uncharacterized protein with von Willebrand factor type A (vWA) domain